MRTAFKTNIIVFLIVLPIFSKAQIVADSSFKTLYSRTEMLRGSSFIATDSSVLPITLQQRISGLSVSGNITFTGDKGFVRIVLTDSNENEYLVLETNTIFENDTTISFNEFCEETALLNNVFPKQITIECTEAQVTINGIQYTTDNRYQTSREKQIKEEQLDVKLQHINAVLRQKEITWGAGKTSISEMSYMEKKSLFGGRLPNLAGFDYYIGGIYVMQGYKPDSNNLTRAPFVSEFDWRNRHGRNWITPVKNQSFPYSCASCWAFAPVGAVEAYANVYYNRLLHLDLSEQDVLSCTPVRNNCSVGYIDDALYYLKNTGVVNEECFTYSASDLPCYSKCPSPNEKIKIGNYTSFLPSLTKTQDELKKLIFKSPMTFGVKNWWHFLGLVGYKTIQVGDTIFLNPTSTNDGRVIITSGHYLVGANAWILKNSWGTSWGNNGFGYIVVSNWKTTDVYGVFSISGITSLKYNNNSIVCEDRDGDGYYYWGSGPKPATCPCDAPDEPDGDDSDPNLGPMDEYGNCAIIPYSEKITTSQTWNIDRIISNDIFIPSGVILTITATAYFSNHTITIKCGGKLIVSGGTIDNCKIVAQNGSELTVLNNGKILLGSYDNLSIQLGAVFNLDYGKVLLK